MPREKPERAAREARLACIPSFSCALASCPVRSASMAAVLLACGTKGKRHSLPNSRILIHQPSMSGLGYREVARYLAGELDLDAAVALFKQATHQYAKRQMTWFKRQLNLEWIKLESVENLSQIAENIRHRLENFP